MLKLLLILLNKQNIKEEPDHKLNRRILTSLISKTLLTARRLDSVNILQRSFSYGNPSSRWERFYTMTFTNSKLMESSKL